MNIEELREYCLNKPGVTECFPFDETTLVFKVMGKMYALTDLESELSINLKCDPELAVQLRAEHSFVTPGYHMNKTHWNTVLIDANLPDKLLKSWIDHSYELVVKSLNTKLKKELELFRN
ncbi:MAG: MmcQ/YjbR family DNA-binding protein [Bacteroidota bacterium]|nr:MAG: MmcQ/YjbR family DNA-binding protein [Bacteroidota bacterium]